MRFIQQTTHHLPERQNHNYSTVFALDLVEIRRSIEKLYDYFGNFFVINNVLFRISYYFKAALDTRFEWFARNNVFDDVRNQSNTRKSTTLLSPNVWIPVDALECDATVVVGMRAVRFGHTGINRSVAPGETRKNRYHLNYCRASINLNDVVAAAAAAVGPFVGHRSFWCPRGGDLEIFQSFRLGTKRY